MRWIAPLVTLTFALMGCSTSSGGEGGRDDGARPPDGACYENPLGCDDGETCAFDDAGGEEMSCQAAGPKGAGETCKNVAGASECGQDLFCLQLSGSGSGTCRKFCDGDSPCGDGEVCGNVKTAAGHSFYACVDS